MQKNQIELFSQMPRSSSGTYFFEEKRANNRINRLMLAKPRKIKKRHTANQIMLFRGYARDFSQMLAEADTCMN